MPVSIKNSILLLFGFIAYFDLIIFVPSMLAPLPLIGVFLLDMFKYHFCNNLLKKIVYFLLFYMSLNAITVYFSIKNLNLRTIPPM